MNGLLNDNVRLQEMRAQEYLDSVYQKRRENRDRFERVFATAFLMVVSFMAGASLVLHG